MINEILDKYGRLGDAVIYKMVVEGVADSRPTIKLQMAAYDIHIAEKMDQFTLVFEDAFFFKLTSLHPLTFIIFSAYIGMTDEGVIFDFDPDRSGDENTENPDSEFIIKAKKVSMVEI